MWTYRPAVRAVHGMVAAAHPLASEAGVAMLRAGGNAIDAGLAVNAVLNVTQPPCCGFGGDAFFLYYEAATGRVQALNASGRAPAAATIAALRERGHDEMPARGPLTVTVPGAVDGWGRLHGRFGRLPWAELFAPAIGYARDGFPVSDKLSGWIRGNHEVLRHWQASLAAMLPGGHPPRPGQRLAQPDLAATLETLAEGGPEAFYRGPIANEIDTAMRRVDGLLRASDLMAHESDWGEPLRLPYRGHEVLVHGPNSQGWALLVMLGLIADRNLSHHSTTGADLVHLGVEAKRLAYAERDAHNADPARVGDITQFLQEPWLANRRRAIADDRAMPDPGPTPLAGDTTYFAVVDAEGNALSVIQSLYRNFGSGFVAGRTGLFLQNRGSYFSLDPDHINALAPGRRTAHTLIAAMVLKEGRPVIVPGSMGGDGQPQILYQLITRLLDHGLNPQEAIELPRWVHGQSDGETALHLEARFDPEVAEALRARGHRLEQLGDWSELCGHAQVICRDDHGLTGGADPRGDGQVAGY